MVEHYKDLSLDDIVYHKTDPDQRKRLIIGFLYRRDIVYIETSLDNEYYFSLYEELSKEKDYTQ